ncbi:NUDIX domain-containing protein [Streptomyces sp. NBC_00250]|uniref:NUDIX domain-containing protein n=1 Tax=Streptomyces sp. NBC_00250 TaxID=2903641 RepID=UPI002E2D8494|nr:NUDIX domain-containing protein [Streptomyces sp. NBC_00250]
MSGIHRSTAHVMVLPQRGGTRGSTGVRAARPGDGWVLTGRRQPRSWPSDGPQTVVGGGGRLEAGESFDGGAARELAEEAGFGIASARLGFCRLIPLHPVDADPAGPRADCRPLKREVLRLFAVGSRYADVIPPERSGGGTG